MDITRAEFEFSDNERQITRDDMYPQRFADFDEGGSSMETASLHSSKPLSLFENFIPSHILMVSLLEHICTFYEADAERRGFLFEVLCQQLVSMKLMPSFTIMNDFKAIRKKYQTALVDWMRIAVQNSDPKVRFSRSLEVDNALSWTESRFHKPNGKFSSSRFREEFEELGEIGRGGFGSVYSVLNNLDGETYAVKKIFLSRDIYTECLKVLREVKVLAKLRHENIVRYHSAWLEYSIQHPPHKMKRRVSQPSKVHTSDVDVQAKLPSFSRSISDTSSISFHDSIATDKAGGALLFDSKTSDSSSLSGPSESDDEWYANLNSGTNSSREDFFSNMKGEFRWPGSEECKEVVPLSNGKRHSQVLSGVNRNHWREYASWGECDCGHKKPERKTNFSLSSLGLKKFGIIMYIQMELCNSTLKDWLWERNTSLVSGESVDWKTNVHIFKQLLRGVQYIHSCGLIHRDLKPRNVFVNKRNSTWEVDVKIGDFGLARYVSQLQGKSSTGRFEYSLDTPFGWSENAGTEANPTRGVGTCTYAAPEQLRNSNYSYKVDIFSLGIILFELFYPFKTEMERVTAIKDLRKGKIPHEVVKEWEQESDLIKSMTSSDPSIRPSADAILHHSLFYDKEMMIKILQNELSKKDAQIARLKEQLALKTPDD